MPTTFDSTVHAPIVVTGNLVAKQFWTEHMEAERHVFYVLTQLKFRNSFYRRHSTLCCLIANLPFSFFSLLVQVLMCCSACISSCFVAISCADPGNPLNGGRSPHGARLSFNATVTFNCNPGYLLVSGDAKRRCIGNDVWSGRPPVCSGSLQALHFVYAFSLFFLAPVMSRLFSL